MESRPLTCIFFTIFMAASCSAQIDLATQEPLTMQGQYLLEAMNQTSAQCQTTIKTCVSNGPNIKKLLDEQKYCDAFKYDKNNENAQNCLVQMGQCSANEYSNLQGFACGKNIEIATTKPLTEDGQKLLNAIDKVSNACQVNIDFCINNGPNINNLLKEQMFCDAFEYDKNQENAYNCLVRMGKCTKSEYDSLHGLVCGANGASSLVAGTALLVVCVMLQLFKGW